MIVDFARPEQVQAPVSCGLGIEEVTVPAPFEDAEKAVVHLPKNQNELHEELKENHNDDDLAKRGDSAYPKFDDMRPGKIVLILFSLGLASFLYAIEQTIVNTSISTIGNALQTDGSLTWISTSYLLTTTVFQPVTGRLAVGISADPFTSWVSTCGTLTEICDWTHTGRSNIIAGFSNSLTQLVAGRLVGGVGGAGLLSLSTIMVSHLTNERQRGSYLNLINLVFTFADAMGPIVGGGFSKSGNWRWIFLFNAPFGPVITAILLIALRNSGPSPSASDPPSSSTSRRGVSSIRTNLARLDFAGMLTLIATLAFLVVALNLGGQSLPWGSPTIIGMFVAAGVSFVLFIVVERYSVQPVAPLGLFVSWRWRNVPLIIVVRTLLFFHLFSMTFYLPLFLQVIGVSNINAGALVIPFLSMAAISSTITNYIAYRTALVLGPFFFALAVLPVGMGLMSTLDASASIGKVVGFSLICGFGFGCGTQISLVIAQVGLPKNELSTVTALVSSAPNLGGVLGVGVVGTGTSSRSLITNLTLYPSVINNTFRRAFTRALADTQQLTSHLNLNDVVALVERPPPGVVRALVVQAYVQAWRTGIRVLAGIAVAQLLLALLLRPVELDDGKGAGEDAEAESGDVEAKNM
ncbi:hypothetical protein H0H81_006150 [Sphagnurus paluster]|uniref:Major facilitator superfamily (MFS) profile domain-containing protein n=1 Tax=Sphagnurus paluster TaxID=117069 RepID=A0A9P7K6P6_9AGAR|nr:hypothetical protein H0H81_006150 [Sphagnurus paluster]